MTRLWKLSIPVAAALAMFGCLLFAGSPVPPHLPLINRLDDCVQARFADPAPQTLGMSRIARPISFGLHYRPDLASPVDFHPENPAEKAVIEDLAGERMQAGLYVFGAAILTADPARPDFRALKGPAAVVSGTPRPAWYPLLAQVAVRSGDALPDWNAIYPLARRAMNSFRDDGKGFETRLDGWDIAARPAIAGQERCVNCHNNPVYHPAQTARLGQAIGGVIYAFRKTPD